MGVVELTNGLDERYGSFKLDSFREYQTFISEFPCHDAGLFTWKRCLILDVNAVI